MIRELGRPMRMEELAEGVRDRTLPEKAIAITFDDGYIDNLERAEPLLARYDLTGLVFVTTGVGGREREYWWDELERIFLQPGELPGTLDLDLGGARRQWELGRDRTCTPDQQEQHRGWHLLDRAPTLRHDVFRQLYYLIQPLPPATRTETMDRLLTWAGATTSDIRPERRAMRPAEVERMVRGGTLDVGAHTVNHPSLPHQEPEVRRAEMAACRDHLEAWCGRRPPGFAYPYGLHDDGTVADARDAGFRFACSGEYRPVPPGTDLFLIPRLEAPAADGDALASLLRWQLQ